VNAIEAEMKRWGRATYRQFQQIYKESDRGSEMDSSKRVLSKLAPQLAVPVEDFFNRFASDDSPSMPLWLCYIADFHPQMVAQIALKTVLDKMYADVRHFTTLAGEVGKAFEEIARQRVAEQTVPKNRMFGVRVPKSKRSKMQRFYNVEKNNRRFSCWERRHKIALGAWLLGEIKAHTGLIDTRVERMGKKQRKLVFLTDEFTDWVRRFDTWKEMLDPMRMALPTKPRDWVDFYSGGYESFDDPFVMNRPNGSNYDFASIKNLYVSVNNIQQVKWKINTKILDVARKCWELERVFDFHEIPLQPYLENGNERPEELRQWKFKQDKIRRMNESNRGRRLQHAKILHLAKKYKEWDEVYFPARVDYRGRVYYMPAYLHPQGNDLARGLLLFGDGQQVMDEDDLERLLIHGANAYGVKGSIEERLHWVGKHQKWFLETAEDPMTNDWWMEASEPFGFLAFCYEYETYTKEGYGYVSHFPVRMDCSNNGMQILHLLLRDKTHAKHCNLIPDQPVGDMYQHIADLVYERLKDQSSESYIASQWFKHGVTRAMAKAAVMNKPYGQSYYHVLSNFLSIIGDDHPFQEGENIDAINYLAEQFNTVAREQLESVVRIQKFLRGCANAIGNEIIRWSTPSGFKIVQGLTKRKKSKVRTIIGNIITWIDFNLETDDIDPRQQRTSITANFIHGIDAAVVHRLAYAMPYDMGFVHDCFISHASNARKVHQDVRKTYKTFFSIDLLAEFRCELLNQYPTAKLPDLPELGTLDVSQIDRAMYLLS
jgi:DNA-directed RNA polymerase